MIKKSEVSTMQDLYVWCLLCSHIWILLQGVLL